MKVLLFLAIVLWALGVGLFTYHYASRLARTGSFRRSEGVREGEPNGPGSWVCTVGRMEP
jgi:hypothetical protein